MHILQKVSPGQVVLALVSESNLNLKSFDEVTEVLSCSIVTCVSPCPPVRGGHLGLAPSTYHPEVHPGIPAPSPSHPLKSPKAHSGGRGKKVVRKEIKED